MATTKRKRVAVRGAGQDHVLSHEERRRLIERPFPMIRYIERKTWAGTLMHDRVPTEGRRLFVPHPDDEEIGHVSIDDILDDFGYSGGIND